MKSRDTYSPLRFSFGLATTLALAALPTAAPHAQQTTPPNFDRTVTLTIDGYGELKARIVAWMACNNTDWQASGNIYSEDKAAIPFQASAQGQGVPRPVLMNFNLENADSLTRLAINNLNKPVTDKAVDDAAQAFCRTNPQPRQAFGGSAYNNLPVARR